MPQATGGDRTDIRRPVAVYDSCAYALLVAVTPESSTLETVELVWRCLKMCSSIRRWRSEFSADRGCNSSSPGCRPADSVSRRLAESLARRLAAACICSLRACHVARVCRPVAPPPGTVNAALFRRVGGLRVEMPAESAQRRVLQTIPEPGRARDRLRRDGSWARADGDPRRDERTAVGAGLAVRHTSAATHDGGLPPRHAGQTSSDRRRQRYCMYSTVADGAGAAALLGAGQSSQYWPE